jgi:hypothetical protein
MDDNFLPLNLNLCGARLFVNPLGSWFLNIFKTCNKIKLRLETERFLANQLIILFRSRVMEGVFVKFRFLFLILMLIFVPLVALVQPQDKQEKDGIYVVVKDGQGEKLEGYLRFSPEELLVSTKDNQEKSVPLKNIEFIKLEKIAGGVPGGGQVGSEGYYSVKLQNSQELFTLRKKYTFSLSTSLGLVTQTVDPERVGNFFQKESTSAQKSQGDKPFVRDKSVVFSLEFKF